MLRIVLCIAFVPYCVLGANILYLDTIPSPSHRIWNEVVVGGLLQNGHNVTLIGYFDTKIQSPNYTVININYTFKFEEFDMESLMDGEHSPIAQIGMLWDVTTVLIDAAYESEALKALLDYPKDKFDLIIFDVFCMYLYPLIEYFDSPPVVAVTPFTLPAYILNLMGTEFYPYYPVWSSLYSDRMTFWQRLTNYGLYIVEYIMQHRANSLVEVKAKERFGANIMSLMEIQKKFNVLLANYDAILDYPQPLPPHIIPVGGLQVKRPAELTEDLQKILDDSKDGVILFSLGTNVQWPWFPNDGKKAFLSAFSKMKQTILWKYDQEDLENIPRNVIIKKWFPQSSILKHKNVKLFITHCGALSTQEAIYNAVPMLGIPFFGDQNNNAVKIETKMIGKQLKFTQITEDALSKIISEIIDNPIYSERIRKYSEAYRSRKETPLETAMFWIELVLKQKDLSYLWPRARDMNFWERQNLDIFLLLFLVLSFILFILFKLVKWVCIKIFLGKSRQKIKVS